MDVSFECVGTFKEGGGSGTLISVVGPTKRNCCYCKGALPALSQVYCDMTLG